MPRAKASKSPSIAAVPFFSGNLDDTTVVITALNSGWVYITRKFVGATNFTSDRLSGTLLMAFDEQVVVNHFDLKGGH